MTDFFKRLFKKGALNIKTTLLAIGIGIFAWLGITFNVFPIEQVEIPEIDIEEPVSQIMLDNDLKIVSEYGKMVSTKIEGKRLLVHSLKKEDFIATLDLSTVRDAGKHIVPITVQVIGEQEATIISTNPSTVEIQVEKFISKEFEFVADAPNISLPEGFKMGELHASPKTITLSGPETLINSVRTVNASSSHKGEIGESHETSGEIFIYNHNGDRITNESITKSIDSVSVYIPIFKQKTLPVSIGFTNVPNNFDLKSLKYTITPEVLDIASSDESIDNLPDINVGLIDLTDINLDGSYTLPITLPDGYQNLSGNSTVKIQFKNENYGKLYFDVDNINILNAPTNLDIKAVTNVINNVAVLGPSSEISNLSSSDIFATVNLMGTTVKEGVQDITVSFIIRGGRTKSWVTGSYKATIRATVKD